MDVVFNYGVYDFETPNFYTKFAQGKLLYELNVTYFQPFYENYVAQNRWVKEQILNLNQEEKQAISDFLWENVLPENKKYKYDFFYDNCATKIRDVIQEVLGGNLEYTDDYIQEELTFRQLIQKNLQANTWGSLGIDIALGAVIDRKASAMEHQFLPEYVFEGASHALIHRGGKTEPLVKDTKILFENNPISPQNNFLTSPLFVLGLLGILMIFVTYRDYQRRSRTRFLDTAIFLISGLLGVLLLLLWGATDHTATANNYNLLWAFPISILMLVVIARKNPSPSVGRYIFLLILLLGLLTIHWFTGVQVFAIGLIPILIALAVRYIYLYWYIKDRG